MSITSALDIYNTALSAVHAKGRLSSIEENSREREECDIWYDIVLRTVQEAAFWPSSRQVSYLALLAERNTSADWVETDPMPEYRFKYALPAACLRPWYLTDFSRFSLSFDASINAITLSTNVENAALVYARKQELITLWSPGQILATVYGLAGHIGGPITGRGEIVQKNFNLANQILLDAQMAVANSEFQQLESIPEVIMARGFAGGRNSPRFYYPYGAVFTASSTNV